MDKNIIVAILIVMSILMTLIWTYYMNHQPIYTLTLGAGKYPATNNKKYPLVFSTNGTCDGVFYGNDKVTAILVIDCKATDYISPNPYLGVVVSYNGTMHQNGIFQNITDPSAVNSNWMGVFDLTPLFLNAAKTSGFHLWSIGYWAYSKYLLPNINGVASTNVGFKIATSVKSWPLSVSGNSIASESGNYG